MAEERTITESIPAALHGERVDRVVALVAEVSRRQACDLIELGRVSLDGVLPDKPSVRVSTDATLQIDVLETTDAVTADADVDVSVVHVDDHVIVVNKAADQVVHPGSGVHESTLVHGLLARFPEIAEVGDSDRPGIVHRLDRGTSGLLMVARTSSAYESLVAQLAERTVSRTYRAVVGGIVESSGGLIDAPLGRDRRDATRRAVVADGRPARTRYQVETRFPNVECTELTCRLETGRTHQIRAHLAAIGHPVAGDHRYGGQDHGMDLSRPFLHAVHLGFEHPATGETLRFDAPLADDLVAALGWLQTDSRAAPVAD